MKGKCSTCTRPSGKLFHGAHHHVPRRCLHTFILKFRFTWDRSIFSLFSLFWENSGTPDHYNISKSNSNVMFRVIFTALSKILSLKSDMRLDGWQGEAGWWRLHQFLDIAPKNDYLSWKCICHRAWRIYLPPNNCSCFTRSTSRNLVSCRKILIFFQFLTSY